VSARVGPLPPEWPQWDRERRTDFVAAVEHRRGLIVKLLLEAGRDPEGVGRDYYLTEKDLAALYSRIIELKGERHD